MRRGFLGIAARQRPLDRRLIRFHGLNQDQAAEVVSVEPRGPAGIAGVQKGDLIVTINGSTVQNADDLQRFLSDWPIGRPVEIEVVRGRDRRALTIVPLEAAT